LASFFCFSGVFARDLLGDDFVKGLELFSAGSPAALVANGFALVEVMVNAAIA
jgi:hypothetical protein